MCGFWFQAVAFVMAEKVWFTGVRAGNWDLSHAGKPEAGLSLTLKACPLATHFCHRDPTSSKFYNLPKQYHQVFKPMSLWGTFPHPILFSLLTVGTQV